MKIEVQKSFEKDIAKVKNQELAIKVLAIINSLKTYQKLSDIPKLKKLNANDSYYRIRIGDYRIGLKVDNETLILLRFMGRKDIYKYFP
jgi:mRNA interferase RelE/StbE